MTSVHACTQQRACWAHSRHGCARQAGQMSQAVCAPSRSLCGGLGGRRHGLQPLGSPGDLQLGGRVCRKRRRGSGVPNRQRGSEWSHIWRQAQSRGTQHAALGGIAAIIAAARHPRRSPGDFWPDSLAAVVGLWSCDVASRGVCRQEGRVAMARQVGNASNKILKQYRARLGKAASNTAPHMHLPAPGCS